MTRQLRRDEVTPETWAIVAGRPDPVPGATLNTPVVPVSTYVLGGERIDCLDPDRYDASQRLARELLSAGSAGVVYNSVRHTAGTCIACFRPALVNNVHKGGSLSIAFQNALAAPEIGEINA